MSKTIFRSRAKRSSSCNRRRRKHLTHPRASSHECAEARSEEPACEEAGRCALRIGWHVPAAVHNDAPALAILTSLLTGGQTSRLYRRLVLEDQIAGGVFSSLGPGSRYPQLLQIDTSPIAPHSTQELEGAIYEEIARLANDGPEKDELERGRNQIAAGAIRRIQSNLGLAFQLAESVSLFDDWTQTFRVSERLQAVTGDDVRRMARLYLTEQNRTVATLVKKEVR